MVWAFDPRKLVEEEKEKENEKKKVKEVVTEQEEYDKIVEEQKAKAEKIKDQDKKKGQVSKPFDEIKDILKEVNYAKKYGGKKYLEEKRKEDPEHPIFDTPLEKIKAIKEQFSDIGSVFTGEFSGEAQAYTLAESEGDKDEKEEKDEPGVFDVDVNDVGAGQAIMASLLSGGI